MFALGIRYLNGWSMAASDGARKEQAEWPPHPDRVFMALAAAYFEGDRSDEARQALEWLERLPAPAITASEATHRTIVTHYVPVNDAVAPSIDTEKLEEVSDAQVRSGLALLPDTRSRQPRQFPVAVPHDDQVFLVWPTSAIANEMKTMLSVLCSQVTCVGHSASLVQMWVADQVPAGNWVPTVSRAERRLRVPEAGRLSSLEAAYNESGRLAWLELEHAITQSKGKLKEKLKVARMQQFSDRPPVSRRPATGFWAGYGRADAEERPSGISRGVFSERLLIFRQVSGPRLGIESTLLLTDVFRDYVLQACVEQPPPEWVSGHSSDGAPSRNPHLAFFPLPHVGYDHADGHLLGLAMAVPGGISPKEIGRCLAPLFELDEVGESNSFKLYKGDSLGATFRLDLTSDSLVALQADTWIGGSEGARTWASVTPIVLDRHSKGSDSWAEAAATVRLACLRVGLPQPEHVVLGPVSHFIGALSTRNSPHLQRKDGGKRHHIHAVLTFSTPIRGPLLIGAGRFRGYGLCRPWPPTTERRR